MKEKNVKIYRNERKNKKGIDNVQEYLATDRTILANERTFLAYIRTGLTFIVIGVSFLKFFESVILNFFGISFVPLGIITIIFGMIRYERTRRLIQKIEDQNHFSIPEN